MRPGPTTAQERGSIVLRTMAGRTTVGPSIGQAYGCTGEHISVGPSLGEPIGRWLLGASTGRAFGWPHHALGPSIDLKSDVLAQAIARGSGGASRRETLWDRAGLGHSPGRGRPCPGEAL